MRRARILLFVMLIAAIFSLPTTAFANKPPSSAATFSIDRMLGEKLSYDVSFLWFKRLAKGTISLSYGPESGQYIALLEAKTLGLTAFLTRKRIEMVETIMEIGPEGEFRPILQSAHTIKGEGEKKTERIRTYRFDYDKRTVLYRNWIFSSKYKKGKKTLEKTYLMGKSGPVYDLLSAFYNVRAGAYGELERGKKLALATFTRRGTDDIVVARVSETEQKRHAFFPKDAILCNVLVDPDTFGTKGRDIYVGFDANMVPQKAVVKKVLGLGDVRGTLRKAVNTLTQQKPGE